MNQFINTEAELKKVLKTHTGSDSTSTDLRRFVFPYGGFPTDLAYIAYPRGNSTLIFKKERFVELVEVIPKAKRSTFHHGIDATMLSLISTHLPQGGRIIRGYANHLGLALPYSLGHDEIMKFLRLGWLTYELVDWPTGMESLLQM